MSGRESATVLPADVRAHLFATGCFVLAAGAMFHLYDPDESVYAFGSND